MCIASWLFVVHIFIWSSNFNSRIICLLEYQQIFFVRLFKLVNILSCTVLPLIVTVIVCHHNFRKFKLIYNLGQKCILCAVLPILFICCLAVQWVFVSSFATFLLSLAYPLHVTTLVVLHLAFMFVLSVTLGVFISEIIPTIKNFEFEFKKIDIKKICTCNRERNSLIFFVIFILATAILLYVLIIFVYAFTVVQRIVPADGVIRGLLFLPSVILFLIGWQLKKRYFSMYDMFAYIFLIFAILIVITDASYSYTYIYIYIYAFMQLHVLFIQIKMMIRRN